MYLLFPAISLLISLVFIRILRNFPLARFFGDSPDHRKVHQSIVPRLGGIGIILSFLAVLGLQRLLHIPLQAEISGSLAGAFLFISLFLLVGGGLDDVKPLNFKVKFALQFALATGVVLLLERDFDTIAILGHRFQLGLLGPILSIFWFVALMNALNIIDGIDGLAGGVALLAMGAIAFIAQAKGSESLVLLCLMLMGCILGFLRFNFSRTHKVFLGDAGSQFLGATLALLSIEVQGLFGTGYSIFTPLFIVGYPLLDVAVAMIRRFRCGHRAGLGGRLLRMFAADNEHLHHRLVYLGLSHLQSSFLLLLLAGGIGATAIIITRLEWPYKQMVIAYLAFAVLMILNRLGYMGRQPWLTFPRAVQRPTRIVGVIEPDEVFLHSLKSFKQDKFAFLDIPGKLSQFMAEDLVAVLLYNASPAHFEEEWPKALRATEIQDCPAMVIAESEDIKKLRAKNPDGFRSVHFMEKPVRIPELIKTLEEISKPRKNHGKPRERSFSLAELAFRNRNNA